MSTNTKNRKLLVDHFGVHQSPEGLWFLHQEGEAINARGLETRSPFVVRASRASTPSHAILLADRGLSDVDAATQRKLLKSQLGRLFLPIPVNRPTISFIEQTPERLDKVIKLAELTSPTGMVIIPSWLATAGALRMAARRTNIQPIIITHIDVKWLTQNRQLLDMLLMGTRPVIMLGDKDVVLNNSYNRVEGSKLDRLPTKGNLKRIGAATLYSFMRNEL